jgi:hypothetical protein
MNTKFRPPLLLIASLAIFLSVAEIVTHPAIAEAGSKIESAGKDMDGDPENWDDSPRVIDAKSFVPEPDNQQSVKTQSLSLWFVYQLAVVWLTIRLGILK